MTSTQEHALIVGASGITGYGLLQNLLSYPTADYWTSITGLTSRPMDKAQALLPDEVRLRLVSGLNLNTPHAEAVVAFLKAIPQIELVSACKILRQVYHH
jgi:N-acetyl-gamma-glutamylphosphate reductase